MDPFLESHWGDVHTSLTTYARNQIRPQLPQDLRVRVEEYLGLEIEEDETTVAQSTRQKPDVRVSERWTRAARENDGGLAVAEPVISDEPLVVSYLSEPQTHRRVLIHDRHGERLVTAIEFLSLGNKVGGLRGEFRRKQRDLADAGVNLVEIDLIRAGLWAMYPHEEEVPGSHREPYRIVVIRADRTWGFECYPAGIRQRLPRIRVPLRPGDRDAVLDVQDLVSMAWEDGGYGDIDYALDPLPKFEDSDHQWIRERLAQQGISRTL